MTRNRLKLLDIDEHLREKTEILHKDALAACAKYDLTLDLATSDVVVYVQGTDNENIVWEVARCYHRARKMGHTRIKKQQNSEWVIY